MLVFNVQIYTLFCRKRKTTVMFIQYIRQLSFHMVSLLNNIFEFNFMVGQQSIEHLWAQMKSVNCIKSIHNKNFIFRLSDNLPFYLLIYLFHFISSSQINYTSQRSILAYQRKVSMVCNSYNERKVRVVCNETHINSQIQTQTVMLPSNLQTSNIFTRPRWPSALVHCRKH